MASYCAEPGGDGMCAPLDVTPRVLAFEFEPAKELAQQLKLRNVTSKPVAFKIRSSAAERYQVKPSRGVLPGRGSLVLRVTRIPSHDYEEAVQCADRFIVVCAPAEEAAAFSGGGAAGGDSTDTSSGNSRPGTPASAYSNANLTLSFPKDACQISVRAVVVRTLRCRGAAPRLAARCLCAQHI